MVTTSRADVIVIGAGIVGLGVAWAAAKQGRSVVILERSSWAQGASIRNFGMVWPIGQPQGFRRDLALRNRTLWCELAKAAGLWIEECGSLHLAHHDDELQVLEEFASQEGKSVRVLTPEETLRRTNCANENGLKGSLWSDTECRVDPRQAIARIPGFLKSLGIEVRFGAAVQRVEGNLVCVADGTQFLAENIVLCSGSDFESLFPEHHQNAGMRRCQLQMMRTVKQPSGFQLGPHLASGLTLRHYESFSKCPSLQSLKSRVASENPKLDAYGIHVMASQSVDGEIVLGDSHLYDEAITPFHSEEIDRLMIEQLSKVYRFPDWTIGQRWSGIYAKHPEQAWVHSKLQEGIHAINGFGGSGMSMSLAVTERIVSEEFGKA